MVARCRIVALVAAVGVSLHGCNDMIQGHVKSFIELTCSMNVDKLMSTVEDKCTEELGKRCQNITGGPHLQNITDVDAIDKFVVSEQKCLDEGATVIDEKKRGAAENYTKACAEELTEATSGKDHRAVREAVQKRMADRSWFQNLVDSIERELNSTYNRIGDDIDDAIAHAINCEFNCLNTPGCGDCYDRLFEMVRLPGASAGASTVACLAGAALIAAAGLVVVARRASRQGGAEERESILACDQELGE